MDTSAIVNYHVASDKQQAYHIDVDGEEGKIVSPVLVPTQVKVKDLRGEEGKLNFWKDSLVLVNSSSDVSDFEASDHWKETYNHELSELLTQQLGAKEIIIFDHTVRVDKPDSGRKPARNVHSDYSESGANERLKSLLGSDDAEKWQKEHFGFVNVWRPVKEPIVSAPLGFIRPQSVRIDDWLTLELIYPDRLGQIMGLTASEAHEWIYLANMTPNEVAIFNIYDNTKLSSIGHSALDFVDAKSESFTRRSIESRTLVRY